MEYYVEKLEKTLINGLSDLPKDLSNETDIRLAVQDLISKSGISELKEEIYEVYKEGERLHGHRFGPQKKGNVYFYEKYFDLVQANWSLKKQLKWAKNPMPPAPPSPPRKVYQLPNGKTFTSRFSEIPDNEDSADDECDKRLIGHYTGKHHDDHDLFGVFEDETQGNYANGKRYVSMKNACDSIENMELYEKLREKHPWSDPENSEYEGSVDFDNSDLENSDSDDTDKLFSDNPPKRRKVAKEPNENKTKTKSKKWTCDIDACGKREKAEWHINVFGEKVKITPDIETFRSIEELRHHVIENHKNRKHFCLGCPWSGIRNGLKQHEKFTTHKDYYDKPGIHQLNTEECKLCEVKVRSKNALRDHNKRYHSA